MNIKCALMLNVRINVAQTLKNITEFTMQNISYRYKINNLRYKNFLKDLKNYKQIFSLNRSCQVEESF